MDGGVEDVWDGGCEVEGGGVEVGSVLVAGGWLGEGEGDSISAQINLPTATRDAVEKGTIPGGKAEMVMGKSGLF